MMTDTKEYRQIDLTETDIPIEIRSAAGNVIVANRNKHLEVGIVTTDVADIQHVTWYRLVDGKFGPLSVSHID